MNEAILNTVQVTSALTAQTTVSFSHCAMTFELHPGDSFEVTERTPPDGYLEIVFDAHEGRPILWLHGWESGDTELSVNGVRKELPPCIRNDQPSFRLKGWPAGAASSGTTAGLYVSDARTQARNLVEVEDSGTTTSYSAPPGLLIWYSGTGVDGNPPRLVLHDDVLRIVGSNSHVVTDT
ncbi:hypothetical protein [Amycolatopsis azurea]|uniref:Uncharacterized protein n=1 Tax=Amycolatopsis azurea DSM 43854 TaxID=1238180 RepID=M2PJM9_9PSEU|nr:hypothetical protein [Amycolatopsis azurea]EMD24698.1 hypothetical protein C791_5718 [Amycolatopsis azurea DSM 43854]OOC08195.1 hypothetical protein B0293_04890 [Amycolatopsis azurea DSM 43854]